MSDKKRWNLSMADGTYPVWIDPKDEEIVRAAAKRVNDILNEYKEKWPNVEKEKLLVMVAYKFSLEGLQLKQQNDTAPYTQKIKELTEMLEEYFTQG